MHTVIGIDPGNNGAACFLHPDDFIQFMTIEEVFDLIICDRYVYIESQTYNARQKGAGTNMRNYGKLEGFFRGIVGEWPTLISPNKWQRNLNVPSNIEYADRKKWIGKKIHSLYPNAELYGPRGGLLDGRSDALAIAHYARTSL